MTKHYAYCHSLNLSCVYRNTLTLELFLSKVKFFILDNQVYPWESIHLRHPMEGDEPLYRFYIGTSMVARALVNAQGFLSFFDAESKNYPLFFESIDDVRHYYNLLIEDRNSITEKAKQQYDASVEKGDELKAYLKHFNEVFCKD